MVTEQDIEQARQAVDRADATIQAAKSGAEWETATAAKARAVWKVKQLQDEFTAQLAAEAQRAKAEKSAAEAIDKMVSARGVAEERRAEAWARVQASLVAALDEEAKYDQGLLRDGTALQALGLTIVDGAEHETGAHRKGGVRLRGRWYVRANRVAVLDWMLTRVRVARLGERGGVQPRPDWRLTDLAAAVPLPPQAVMPPRLAVERPPNQGTPVLVKNGHNELVELASLSDKERRQLQLPTRRI